MLLVSDLRTSLTFMIDWRVQALQALMSSMLLHQDGRETTFEPCRSVRSALSQPCSPMLLLKQSISCQRLWSVEIIIDYLLL